MSKHTITGTIKAQLASCYGPQDLRGVDPQTIISRLSFAEGDMSKYGYSVVGTAEVTVTLFDEDTMVGAKVEALRAEATRVQAEATAKVTQIEHQIQRLLAITNEAPA